MTLFAGVLKLAGMASWRILFLSLFVALGLSSASAQAPPAVPPLPDQARLTSYSLTGSTCTCAVNFALYGDSTDYQSWVVVYINGVLAPYNGVNAWTITSPTGPLAAIPRPVTDAILTFAAPVTGTVEIVGARRPRRTAQFNENQGVPARALNQLLTDIIAQNRETWDKINDVNGRGLFFPPGNVTGTLPPPSMCENQWLTFDATGLNPECSTPANIGVTLGTGVATALAQPVTGSGSVVLATSPTLTGQVTANQTTAVDTLTYAMQVNRVPTFTGSPSAGYESAAFYATNTPPSTDTNYEDAGLFILNNYATASGGAENSATRSVAINNGTGSIWAQANEVRDLTNTNNPTGEQAGIEMAMRVNGTDTGKNRVIYDAICATYNQSGLAPTCTYGLRVGGSAGDSQTDTISYGISLGELFNIGHFYVGIDMSQAVFSSNIAINIPSTAGIEFDAGGSEIREYVTSGNLVVSNGSVNLTALDTSGDFTAYAKLSGTGIVLTGSVPTVSAGQVGIGNSVTTANFCGSLPSSTGCFQINVAGTSKYIAYY